MADNKTCTTQTKTQQNANGAGNCRPLCVFGVLDTSKGQEIAKEMLHWLAPVYDLHMVEHDGSQFELPALREAQRWSMEQDQPVLYIHTRGAVNVWRTTLPTRRMWAQEFGVQWRKYFTLASIEQPLVVCPFRDYDKETRYNGFVANAAAWAQLDLQEVTDRHVYERLWCDKPDTQVIGLLINREDWAIKDIRNYLYRNYEK